MCLDPPNSPQEGHHQLYQLSTGDNFLVEDDQASQEALIGFRAAEGFAYLWMCRWVSLLHLTPVWPGWCVQISEQLNFSQRTTISVVLVGRIRWNQVFDIIVLPGAKREWWWTQWPPLTFSKNCDSVLLLCLPASERDWSFTPSNLGFFYWRKTGRKAIHRNSAQSIYDQDCDLKWGISVEITTPIALPRIHCTDHLTTIKFSHTQTLRSQSK